MTVEFAPSRLSGTVCAPPSKSIAHRLLLCAGLAAGESTVENVAQSDDILATLRCLEAFGVQVCIQSGNVRLVSGGLPNQAVEAVLPCNECGSTLRFFLPLCMCVPGQTRLSGSARLLARPLSVYGSICKEQHILFQNDGETVTVGAGLSSGVYSIPGNISSQFVSGLLFALPLLNGDSTLILTESVESRPYIDLTLDALGLFGITAGWQDDRTLVIPGGQRYWPAAVRTEGDWSNAAVWFALRSLGMPIGIEGLNLQSRQGDRVCMPLLNAISAGNAVVDLSDCPDLGPVLMAAAAISGKGAVFTGTRRLRIKESDRGAAMAQELSRCGICTEVEENRITVLPGTPEKPERPVDGHNDHRIVMALSCLLLFTGGALKGAEAVNKSYPDFFEQVKRLGAAMNISKS